ncbi:MAG: maleylacetoacetate isomerase [Rhizobiales bacterium]|nr:maleylacetoacetate isomerase [Hyphomicrobiales bacterium]
MLKLYSFFRSGASYRARIALALKGIPYETVGIHLARDGGEQNKPAYRAVNPQGRVPALELEDGTVITQSLAIIDYLETVHPEPRLYPQHPLARANALSIAFTIAADIHPLQNTSTTNYLAKHLNADEAAIKAWYQRWIGSGLAAVETKIIGTGYALGGSDPTIADICIVAQLATARRLNFDLSAYPKVVAVDAHATRHPAFVKAHPLNQPDAE